MADSENEVGQSLLHGNQILVHGNQIQEEDPNDHLLNQALRRLEIFFLIFGFYQHSILTILLSWTAFLLLGVAVPALTIYFSRCSDCSTYQITKFELFILASQVILAAVSLLCVSRNLRKYGIRRLILLDFVQGQMPPFHKEYVAKIQGFFRLLVWWVLPCLLLKTLREMIRLVFVHRDSWWEAVGISLALIVSWTYLTTIFLSACCLFNLVCNLQAVHFEVYGMHLDSDSDSQILLEDHMHLRYNLHKISHRFRINLLLAFLVVTASQVLTLFETTEYHGIITLANGGDFAVCTVVEVVGIILCLHSAAKISHRAQGIAAIACRWHASVTCSSDDTSQAGVINSMRNLEHEPIFPSYSESDLESFDEVALPTNTQLSSSMTSYHKRQALVMYLQSNHGGLSIYGWTVDRTLINTIFFIELSLVLFVLGKTLVFS